MEDSKGTGRSSSIRLPGPVSWMATPLARRGIHAGAFTLLCSAVVATAALAAYWLPALAASAVVPSRLTLLTAFAGHLLGALATLGLCVLLLTAPAWITASVVEKRLQARVATSRSGDSGPADRRGRRRPR
jgi:hypothetical protein